MNCALRNLGKIAATAGLIVAMAFGVGSLSPRSADADIFSLEFRERDPSERFADALDHLGHGEPRSLEINGNDVYFSAVTVSADPAQVWRDYRRAFEDQGMDVSPAPRNEAESKAATERSMQGGLVTLVESDTHILVGSASAAAVGSSEELRRLAKAGKAPELDSHRLLEITRLGTGRTEVVASWSHTGFDYDKMAPGAREVSSDSEIPACEMCSQRLHYRDRDPNQLLESTVFVSPLEPERALDSYRSQLAARGWIPLEITGALARLESLQGAPTDHQLLMEREGVQLTVVAQRVDSKTTLHVTRSR